MHDSTGFSCEEPRWQRLHEENQASINEMAINLIEKRKGTAYCKAIVKLFRNSAAHRAQVAPEYRERLQEVLSKGEF